MLRRIFIAALLTATILLAPFAFLYVNTFSNGWVGVPTDFSESPLLREKPAPLKQAVDLRVVTFNIQDLYLVARDHEPRMIAIARKLGELDPDIVGFQEAFIEKHRALLIAELEKHTRLRHFQYYPSGKAGSGLLTASAFPIQEAWFHRYAASNPWWKIWEGDYWAGKGVGLARIELPDGAGSLDFFNTHAQASYGVEANRAICALQMGEFGKFIAAASTGTSPAVAVGDLNCRIGSDGFTALVQEGGLTRAMNIESRIDHILTANNPAYEVEVQETIEISEQVTSDGVTFELSDHPGYLSHLTFKPTAADDSASAATDSLPTTDRPNVLLVVIDTLRGDRVAAERNGIAVMPHLHAYARGSAWFTHAASPATWTKPAMTSILTGLYPETHGVQFGVQKAWFEGQNMAVVNKLPADTPTIATVLKGLGYQTACIQTNQHITSAMGYGQGFDTFEFYFAQPAGLVTDKSLSFLASTTKPWFLYAHYIDPHAGYNPPEPYRSAFGPLPEMTPQDIEWLKDENYHHGYYIDRFKYDVGFIQERQYGEFTPNAREAIRQLYDGECLYNDAELKRLLDIVHQEHPNTLVIITSDHGEEFWEHGSIGHGKTVYEELVHVPLIVRAPGQEPIEISAPVETLDIAPTIARFLGVEPLATWQGRNLLAADETRPHVYSSTKGSIPEFGLDAATVYGWPFKLIEDRMRQRTMLFDVSTDPAETQDLSAQSPEKRDEMLALLRQHRDNVEKKSDSLIQPEEATLSPEDIERLESMGYIDASAKGDGEGEAPNAVNAP